MFSHRLTFLIALFSALALPLHAVAGLVMPLGEIGEAMHTMATDAAAMPDDCPMHQAQDRTDQAPSHPATCGHCGICHLANAALIAIDTPAAATVPMIEIYVATLVAALSSHIPDPPQHPPRRSA